MLPSSGLITFYGTIFFEKTYIYYLGTFRSNNISFLSQDLNNLTRHYLNLLPGTNLLLKAQPTLDGLQSTWKTSTRTLLKTPHRGQLGNYTVINLVHMEPGVYRRIGPLTLPNLT